MPGIVLSQRDFEDWLFSICPVYDHPNVEGIYFIPLSPYVHIRLETPLSSNENEEGPRSGQCRLRLESRLTKRRLDSKDRSVERRYRRTPTWQTSWAVAVDQLCEEYNQHQEDMDEEAQYPFAKHKEEMTALITSLDWKKDRKLSYFMTTLEDGAWLTLWQEKHLSGRANRAEEPSRRRVPVPKVSKDDTFLALAKLEEKATEDSDNWVLDFVKSIRLRVLNNKGLSKRQRGKLTEKCAFYKIPLPSLM